MPEYKLEFKMPDDSHEFWAAARGMEYSLALWEIWTYARNKLKYETLSPETTCILEEIQALIPSTVIDE